MCAELQLEEVKRPWLVGVNVACAFVGGYAIVFGLLTLNPIAIGLGMLGSAAGISGTVVAKD